MKRIFFPLSLILAISATFISCKKDKDPDADLPPLTDVVGYWVGMYGTGQGDPNKDYAFLVKPDNRLIVYSQTADTSVADKATGTWTFDKQTKKFTSYYVYHYDDRPDNTHSTKGELIHRSLTGTWGNGLETSGGGTFKVTFKQ